MHSLHTSAWSNRLRQDDLEHGPARLPDLLEFGDGLDVGEQNIADAFDFDDNIPTINGQACILERGIIDNDVLAVLDPDIVTILIVGICEDDGGSGFLCGRFIRKLFYDVFFAHRQVSHGTTSRICTSR
ncbi:MAG: hypothetical protein R3C97_00670 [Geminicoccaceae bacterium]